MFATDACIEIHNKAGYLCPINPRKQSIIIKAMLKQSEVCIYNLAIFIVRDAYIMNLNRDFLNSCGPTNVLSFPAQSKHNFDLEHTPNVLVISVDTLQRECALYGQKLVEHFVRLIAHGLAHLMGFEHGVAMFNLCEKMENAGLTAYKNI